MKTVLVTVLVCALAGLAAAALVLWRGWYDVSATVSHTQVVHDLLELALRRSVRLRAAEVQVPPLEDTRVAARGAVCYRDHCAQCHGGPGVEPSDVGKSLQPLPGPLVDAARRWQARELYWITRHGIKMTGMPAWELRLADRELWAVTAFLLALPELSPAAYRQTMDELREESCPTASQACLAGRCPQEPTADQQPLQPRDDDEAARLLLRQYACVACHRIPGVVGSDVDVAPPLHGLRRRSAIAGGLPNTPEQLARWIQSPRHLRPGTAMPELGVTDAHARRMADYLLDRRH
ncbi:MAG TPA: c-type cytochrome [Burkholderiaceae bacterium]|nr:c-type cytochrome [Burkholderiaceae bacterium]